MKKSTCLSRLRGAASAARGEAESGEGHGNKRWGKRERHQDTWQKWRDERGHTDRKLLRQMVKWQSGFENEEKSSTQRKETDTAFLLNSTLRNKVLFRHLKLLQTLRKHTHSHAAVCWGRCTDKLHTPELHSHLTLGDYTQHACTLSGLYLDLLVLNPHTHLHKFFNTSAWKHCNSKKYIPHFILLLLFTSVHRHKSQANLKLNY